MNNKTPPSEMIRVPTVLIPVVRNLAKIHRDGHTTALLQGLQELIAQFDSSVKLEVTDELQQVEEKLGELETHLCQQDQQVATKLEVLGKQLEKIEKAPLPLRTFTLPEWKSLNINFTDSPRRNPAPRKIAIKAASL